MLSNRRTFLAAAAAALASTRLPAQKKNACPFRLAVINDEISPDFDHACSVAANDFGLHWIELRSLWGKTVTELSPQQTADAQAHPRQIQPPRHRHRQPPLQVRLPRGSPLQTLPQKR